MPKFHVLLLHASSSSSVVCRCVFLGALLTLLPYRAQIPESPRKGREQAISCQMGKR